jgi:diguanylate cyclase (GGDEF)-like protein/putative nucleotidyltransferase with HDIG domain
MPEKPPVRSDVRSRTVSIRVAFQLAGLAQGLAVLWWLWRGDRQPGWQALLLVLPGLFLAYYTYRVYLERLEDHKRHARELAALHFRTIEALALAIDAKDGATHQHLRRVEVFAVEIGKELGLSAEDLAALRAAALLHDIGKLAVPEHIISKPGRLTPEEFEKLKIHPVVGAEILERARFPYPVAPIVRAHHERWDGLGYPDGLRGEQIPIGARILAAVDCLDAIASERRYRRALPLMDAMEIVAAGAGTAFDPRVVEILRRRYVEFERIAQEQARSRASLNAALKVERGAAPAAGFEADGQQEAGVDFLSLIAAARQEVQVLLEVAHDLGASLSLHETLSVLALRLRRMIPYDSIAIYVLREDQLHPEYVSGENFRAFSAFTVPLGKGLTGWVAQNRRPILNGNPEVEAACRGEAAPGAPLGSALAVPLEGVNGLVGVLALYRVPKDAFTRDHLRLMLAISSKIAACMENALKYKQAETSATTDALTGLPNTRSLFLHLDRELARARREHAPLAVLVCDLDGFKQVNDRYGHLEGNRLLKALAAAMKDACREYDYVARMGGDEFVVVLPGAGAEEAHVTAARLAGIARAVGRTFYGDEVLSLSVGQSLYPEDGSDAEQLLAEADRRMFRRKHWRKCGAETAPAALESAMQTSLVQ